MSDAVNLITEAELSDGTLAVVEDALNKNVFHVYKKDKNVQPNHDAKGIMRYLMHVMHALGYRADKADRELEEKKKEVATLEAKVKLLEKLVGSVNTDGPDVNLTLCTDQWMILYTLDGRHLFRRHSATEWSQAASPKDILNIIYEKENL